MNNRKTVQLEDFQTGGLIELEVVPNGVATQRPEPVDRNKPGWLRATAPTGPNYVRLKELTQRLRFSTVCQEAMCPNIGECWDKKHATFMIMGDTCTRACAFCNVKTGIPGALDANEQRKSRRRSHDIEHSTLSAGPIAQGGRPQQKLWRPARS